MQAAPIHARLLRHRANGTTLRDAEHGFWDARDLIGCGFPYVGTTFEGPERVMVSGSAELHYNLYAEPTRRQVLGDGSEGTIAFPALRSRGVRRVSWPVFGAIAPGQRVPAGIYTDTLLIQVEF